MSRAVRTCKDEPAGFRRVAGTALPGTKRRGWPAKTWRAPVAYRHDMPEHNVPAPGWPGINDCPAVSPHPGHP